MGSRRTLAALALALVIATAAVAQDAADPHRASSGPIQLFPKSSNQLSGSLGITMSDSSRRGYEATFGGTVVEDRLWFFGAGQRYEGLRLDSTFPQTTGGDAFDAKLTAQLGDRTSLAAAAGRGDQRLMTTPLALPTSFLSFHATSVVSSNTFFSASFSRRKTEPVSPFAAFTEP